MQPTGRTLVAPMRAGAPVVWLLAVLATLPWLAALHHFGTLPAEAARQELADGQPWPGLLATQIVGGIAIGVALMSAGRSNRTMATLLRIHPVTAVRFLAVTIGVGLVSAPSTAAAQEPSGAPVRAATSPSDEARIRAIIAEQVAAWNAGDARAFSASFAEEGSFTNIRGTVFCGHRAFEDRHVEIFRTFFKGSKLAMSPTKIRFVRPDVAIVDVATELRELRGAPPGITPGADGRIRTRLQEVLVKNGGEWRVESYHNVDVKGP